MPRAIRYFVTMASPWAYLGHAAFATLAARHGARVTVLPLPFRDLFPETGGLPLPKRHPVRQRYRLVELQRWRERRGLPLILRPRHAPLDPTAADRLVIAVAAAGHDPDPFMRRVFAAFWAENRDVADPGVLASLLEAEGLPAGLLADAGAKGAADAYEANLRAALDEGVFGAPSYVLDGEIFWGQDRLDLLGAALESGRAPFRAD